MILSFTIGTELPLKHSICYDRTSGRSTLQNVIKKRKTAHKVQMTGGKRNIIQILLQEYDIESSQDIRDALKALLDGTINEMIEAEMNDQLGYSKSERSDQ